MRLPDLGPVFRAIDDRLKAYQPKVKRATKSKRTKKVTSVAPKPTKSKRAKKVVTVK